MIFSGNFIGILQNFQGPFNLWLGYKKTNTQNQLKKKNTQKKLRQSIIDDLYTCIKHLTWTHIVQKISLKSQTKLLEYHSVPTFRA